MVGEAIGEGDVWDMGRVQNDFWAKVFEKFVCPISAEELTKKRILPEQIKMIRMSLAMKPVTMLKVVGLEYGEPQAGSILQGANLAPKSWERDNSLYWALKVQYTEPLPSSIF